MVDAAVSTSARRAFTFRREKRNYRRTLGLFMTPVTPVIKPSTLKPERFVRGYRLSSKGGFVKRKSLRRSWSN